MQLGVLAGGQLLGGFGMKLATLGASVAGSMLLNGKQKPQGKINDLRVSSSSYGRGIPIVEGTMRVTGNMMWATDFEEEKNYITQKGKRKNGSLGKKKSKKGKATETYEYFANFAMGLCEGPVDSIIRIWADNNLIYDKLNRDDEDDPLVEIGFSQDNDSGGGKREMKSPARKKGHSGDSSRFAFRFYPGSEDQLPDPFIVEKQGENAVAFRGMAYLFFEKFALADFGNRTPTITAEISMRGERKPIVRVFENMEPKTGWNDPFTGKEVLDPVRKRLYHLANRDGIDYVRVYNMETFKEIKRIPVGPPSAVPQLPQMYEGTEITDFGNFIGVSAQGDFVFQYPLGNNYNPLIWVNPNSMQVVRFWGSPANLGLNEPNGVLGRATYATPFVMNGSDMQASATAVTAVTTLFGAVAFFDESVGGNPRTFADRYAPNGIRSISPGAYGTDQALVIVANNIYSLTGQIFTAPIDEPLLPGDININAQKEFYRFPTVEDDPDDDVFISDILFAGYCAGSRSIAMIGYILSGSEKWPGGIYAISVDPQTGERLWIERIIGLGNQNGPENLGIPTYLGGNQFCWITGSGTSNMRYVTVDFRAEEYSIVNLNKGQVPGVSQTGTYYYSDLAALLYMTEDITPGETNWVLASIDKRVQSETTVSDICYDVSTRVGIPPERMDFSGMAVDEVVTGYMIESPTPAKEVLEELANVFMFDVVESDNMLKFRSRGSESVVTIPQDDLGIVESDFGTENEYYTETRQQEVELPERVNVSFINPKEEYETGTEHYKRPLRPLSVMSSREMLELTLNMAMKPSRAKTLAKRILFAAWSERTTHEYALPRDYLMYEPSDVITVELDNGERFTDRITDIEIGADLSMRLHTVSHIAGSYAHTATSGPAGGLVKIPSPSDPTVKAGVFDVPYLSDNDVDEQGSIVYYWGALAYDDGFKFGALMTQIPGNDSDLEEYTNYDSFWGIAQGLIAAPKGPAELTDFDTTITLVPAFDFNADGVNYVWESIPDGEWPSEKNMVIIGDEVILFKDVEVLDNGAVTISTLIRGAKGTGEAAFTHTKTGEEWVLVLPNTIRTGEEFQDNLNIPTWFMIQSKSYLPPAATKITKSLTGATRRPWQVGTVKRQNVAGAITVSWNRATRWGGALMNGNGNVALNEDRELYEVFLLKAPYDPKTWDPSEEGLFWDTSSMFTTPSFTWTADQLAEYGMTSTNDIHVVIYQLSATVGRGYPRGITLPYTVISI